MGQVLERHDGVTADVVGAFGGRMFKHTGDGAAAVFPSVVEAIEAAVELNRRLDQEKFPVRLKVRQGLHTGEANARDDDYFGPAVNRAARLMSVAHGGQIVVSQAAADVARDGLRDGFGLVDLGEHRLRDLSRPERVFQVAAAGIEPTFPPLGSVDARPGNLPAQLSSFVGREVEIKRVCGAVSSSRIVTLTGVGGVGKTRLALQIAAEVVPDFEDGAWVCELAAAGDAEAMVQLVAATLCVSPRPGVDLEGSIIESLRTRSLLVVLDNCEHLLDPAGRLSERIVRECPKVRVLATSREGLSVEGEQVWPLRPLPVPERGNDLGAAAVRLFTDRAEAARPGFVLDIANAEAVTEVCRRLDGIPLAIELAAARVVAMSPAEIAGHLDERFRLLTGGRRTAVERHQTLRATVDWSYSLLRPTERQVFDRLGVFSGTFFAEAATSVTTSSGIDAWDVLDALRGLVAKSMVAADDGPGGVTRCFLLETLRQYARERLDESKQADTWRRRHAEHYGAFAEAAGPGLRSPDEVQWRRRVLEDLDNLRAAFTWSIDSDDPPDWQLGLRILEGLGYESVLNRASGIAAWAERARVLELADRGTPSQRVAVYGAAAWHAIMRGDCRRARQLAASGLEGGAVPDSPGIDEAYTALAYVAASEGRHEELDPIFTAEHHSLDEAGDRGVRRAVVYASQALFEMATGHFTEARSRAEQALGIARSVGNPSALAMALYAVAWATDTEDPDTARAAYEESIALSRSGASDAAFSPCLSRVAPLRLRAGDTSGAIDALREAVMYSRDAGDRGTLAWLIPMVALVAHKTGLVDTIPVLMGISDSEVIAPTWAGVDEGAEVREAAAARLGALVYESGLARGASLPYDDAVAFTLEALLLARTALRA
jgi:predicted ATPase